jgi:serine/threonine protein kinase
MGRVYLAVHPEIGSRVAIKIFSRDWDTRSDLVDRFFDEARATNLIKHGNIINVVDVARLTNGRPYMVMEFLDGLPLSKLVGSPKLNDSSIVLIIMDVLAGLQAAHGHQIIHRDLKPDNIFVSPEGNATLLDFGVAKLVPTLSDSGPTTTGTILGTPHYMSPEQAVGDPIDLRTDIYALGIILFECCIGHRPFEGTSLYRLLDQHIQAAPPLPTSLRPELATDLEDVILRALAKKPSERFQSAQQMYDALQNSSVGKTLSRLQRIHLGAADANRAATKASSDLRPTVEKGRLVATDAPVDGPATAATLALGKRSKDSGDVGSEVRIQEANVQLEVSTPEPISDPARSRASRSPLAYLGAGLLGLAAVVGIYVSVSSEARQEPQKAVVQQRGVDMAIATPVPRLEVAVDAVTPDAATPDAATPRAQVRAKNVAAAKSTGIAPLSLLPRATRLAKNVAFDAALSKIVISGMDSRGRVLLDGPGNRVTFSFYSQKLAQEAATHPRGTNHGRCLVVVRFKKRRGQEVLSSFGDCTKLKVSSAPACTIAELLHKNRNSLKIPADASSITAVYQTIRLAKTARWELSWGTNRRSVNACR